MSQGFPFCFTLRPLLWWDDESLYFAVTACALFNFYNRWVDATGVHALSREAHRHGAKRMAAQGYIR